MLSEPHHGPEVGKVGICWEAPGILKTDPFLRADAWVKRMHFGCRRPVPKINVSCALQLSNQKSSQIGSIFPDALPPPRVAGMLKSVSQGAPKELQGLPRPRKTAGAP